MKKIILTAVLSLSLLSAKAEGVFHKTLKLMGSRFDITVVAKDSVEAHGYIGLAVNEITRIEQLISSWDVNSETSAINKQAGIQPVQVSEELFDLIARAQVLSILTDGAFDISYASMDRIWKFDGSMTVFPTEEALNKSVEKVGYESIVLDRIAKTVFLPQKGMKIGFGGIGKGYAADQAKALLMAKRVKAGIINASGDMNTWGIQPDGSPWQVAITNPLNKQAAFGLFPIENRAVVTSGNYENYVILNGKRYAHIIDPRTGIPASGIISVSVFAPKAELADALATSIFVMGIQVGLDRVNQLKQVDCIIIDDQGKIFTSQNISINEKEN